MPQLIDVPGMGTVEFPDGMSDQEMVAAIQRTEKHDALDAELRSTRRKGKLADALTTIADGAEAAAGVVSQMNLLTALPRAAFAADQMLGLIPKEQANPNDATAPVAEFSKATPEEVEAATGIGGKPAQIISGVQRAAAGFGDFFLSPNGMMTLGAGAAPAAARAALGAGFAGSIAANVPEAAQRFGEATVDGTLSDQVATGMEVGANILLPAAIASHGVKWMPPRDVLRPEEAMARQYEAERSAQAGGRPLTEPGQALNPRKDFVDLRAPEVLPETGQSKTITGPGEPAPVSTGGTAPTDARQGAEIPADPGVTPGPAAPPTPPRKPRAQPADRPYDILDAIEDHMGGRLSLTYARKIREDFRPTSHIVRKLFARDGYALDVALDTLHREGLFRNIETEDQFLDAIEEAPHTRAEFRGGKSAEQKQVEMEQAQKADFQRLAIRNLRVGDEAKATDKIPTNQFYEGDEFKLGGTKFKVTRVEFDEETGEVNQVEVEDGSRFGVQKLNGSEVIHADAGSIKSKEPNVSFDPETIGRTRAAAEKLIEDVNGQSDRPLAAFDLTKNTKLTDPEQFASFDLKGRRSGSIVYLDDHDAAKLATDPESYALAEVYSREGYDRAISFARRLAARPETGRSSVSRYPSHQAFLARVRKADELWRERQSSGAPEAAIEQGTLPRSIEAPPDISGAGPVSLASIREYLSKALDIPVREGVRVQGGIRRALGYFMPKSETIRLRTLNDIPTLAHEVGHYLHFILFPEPAGGHMALPAKASTFAGRFDAELRPLGLRTSGASYSADQVRKEGVAEFFREYLTDRSKALMKAPQFTAFFESELLTKFPEIWKIVTRARADIARYIGQPALAKVMSMISSRPVDEATPLRQRLEKLYNNWVSELAPIERAERRLAAMGLPPMMRRYASQLATNYIGGWRGKVDYSLRRRQINFDGTEVGPSLREILGGIKDLPELDAYLVAKRVGELSKRGKETGIHANDAANVVTQLASKYEATRLKLREFLHNELEMLYHAGLITAEDAARMTAANEDYVPFHRVYERETAAGMGGGGAGFVDVPRPLRSFKGDTRQIISPLESIVKNTYLFRDVAERNRVGVAFVDAVNSVRGGGRVADQIARSIKPVQVSDAEVRAYLKTLGIDKLEGADDLLKGDVGFKVWRAARTQSATDGIFSVWRQGKEEFYQLDDADLYRALQLQDSADASIFNKFAVLKIPRAFTRALRAGSTLTLEFIARNPFKDQVTAGVYSKYGFIPFWDGFRGALSAVTKDQHYWDWVRSGGRYADFIAMDRTDLQKKMGDVLSKPLSPVTLLQWTNPLKTLQKWSELMEMGTRIGEYRKAKAAGASDVDAANASKDVSLNFSRAGFQGRLYNQLVAFFNSQIQDLDKFTRAHREAPLRTTAKAMALITVPSVLTWWLGKDDEKIKALPEWRKTFFWNVNIQHLMREAGMDVTGDTVIMFPKPFLLGQIYGTSVERGLDYATKRDPNAVTKWLKGVSQSTPISWHWETMFLNPDMAMPTGMKPPIEALANYSFFRGQPLENEGMKRLPAAQRANAQTSETAKLAARLAEMAFDGDMKVSPIQFDNFVRGVFGGMAKYGTDAIDWGLAKAQVVDVPPAPAKSLVEFPLIRGFTQSPYTASEYVQRFYKGAEMAEQRIAALRAGAQNLNTAADQAWIRRNLPDLAVYLPQPLGGGLISAVHKGKEALADVNKAMVMVQNDRTMSPETKREKLIRLNEARNNMAKFLFETTLSPNDRTRAF